MIRTQLCAPASDPSPTNSSSTARPPVLEWRAPSAVLAEGSDPVADRSCRPASKHLRARLPKGRARSWLSPALRGRARALPSPRDTHSAFTPPRVPGGKRRFRRSSAHGRARVPPDPALDPPRLGRGTTTARYHPSRRLQQPPQSSVPGAVVMASDEISSYSGSRASASRWSRLAFTCSPTTPISARHTPHERGRSPSPRSRCRRA